MAPVSASKNLGVHYLRGFAALCVFIFHFRCMSPGFKDVYPFFYRTFSYGHNGVEIFFLISGFIITYTLKKQHYSISQLLKFMAKRAVRIDPPYLVTCIIAIALSGTFASMSKLYWVIPFNIKEFLAHAFYFVPFTPYRSYIIVFWTLFVEFQFYLLMGIFYFAFDNRYYKWALLILFSVSGFFETQYHGSVVFYYASIFATGISLMDFYEERKWQNFILPAVFSIMTGLRFGFPVAILLVACCFIIVYYNHRSAILNFFGNISYSFYLLHALVITFVQCMAEKFHIPNTSYQLTKMMIDIAITTGVSYLFYKVIEEPSQKLSKKLFKANPEVQP